VIPRVSNPPAAETTGRRIAEIAVDAADGQVVAAGGIADAVGAVVVADVTVAVVADVDEVVRAAEIGTNFLAAYRADFHG
jgi:hypothetical protein